MKRIQIYAAAIVAALVPAVLGLWGNASFSQDLPVRVPAEAETTSATPTPSRTPTSSPTPRRAEDRDRGRGRDHPEDSPGTHGTTPSDDAGSTTTEATGTVVRGGAATTTGRRQRRQRGVGWPRVRRLIPPSRRSPCACSATPRRTAAGESPASADVPPRPHLAHGGGRPDRSTPEERPLSTRRVVAQLVVGVLVVLAVVTVGGSLAARRLAEREAVNDAAQIADVLAETVVQPDLTDGLLAGDPAAIREFDALVRDRVLGDNVVRVKIWSPEGEVLYADQPELIGQRFALDAEEREVLEDPRTVAEISDLDREENSLDREIGDRLVEVYRPVWTASGGEALFEIYTPYDEVGQRTGQLWRGFAGVTLSSLLLFLVLVAPLVWHLVSRVRRAQRQRERLLERAVDASAAERRRIAASLHDGPVQDLAGASFVIAGATAHAESAGETRLTEELRGVAGSVRTSIRALRTLLVDIYPPSLARAGLAVALHDLAQTVRAPGLQVQVVPVPDDLGLRPDQERLVYRVAQETLRNAARHATPCTARISLQPRCRRSHPRRGRRRPRLRRRGDPGRPRAGTLRSAAPRRARRCRRRLAPGGLGARPRHPLAPAAAARPGVAYDREQRGTAR